MQQPVFSPEQICSAEDFNSVCLATFQFQYEENPVYRSYCDLLHVSPVDVQCINAIPYLPIQFFKSHKVRSVHNEPELFLVLVQLAAKEHQNILFKIFRSTRKVFDWGLSYTMAR